MPTEAIRPFPSPLWWKDWMGKVHYSMAVLMFATFRRERHPTRASFVAMPSTDSAALR